MDVLLEPSSSVCSITPSLSTTVNVAEPVLAKSVSELVPEVRQLKRRGIRMVSIRRQQMLRIGPTRMQEVIADAGLEVSSIGFAGGFTGTLGRGYRQAVDDARRAIDLAAQFRARSVVVVSGSRGMHTQRHAERTIRDGLYSCLDDALRLRVTMLVPLNTVFGHGRDCYTPDRMSSLDWLNGLESHRIRGLVMLRGTSPWTHVPDCWLRCLTDGGYLRISPRCRMKVGMKNLLGHITSRLSASRREARLGTRAG